MKKEFNEKFESVLAHLGDDRMNREVRQMPITKGQKLTFTGETELVTTDLTDRNGQKVEYGVFVTKEGFNVPFGQVARRNNGLGLTGKTMKEALTEFAARIDGTYSVVVEDIKKVESSFDDNKQTYLKFKSENV